MGNISEPEFILEYNKAYGQMIRQERRKRKLSLEDLSSGILSAYISFHVDEHRKTSANTLYVNFNAKDGDYMQIYYVENRPEKVFRFAWTAYLFG